MIKPWHPPGEHQMFGKWMFILQDIVPHAPVGNSQLVLAHLNIVATHSRFPLVGRWFSLLPWITGIFASDPVYEFPSEGPMKFRQHLKMSFGSAQQLH